MFFAIMRSDLQDGKYTQYEKPVLVTGENYLSLQARAQAFSVLHQDCTFTVVLTDSDFHMASVFDDMYSVLMQSLYSYFRGERTTKSSVDLHEEYYSVK